MLQHRNSTMRNSCEPAPVLLPSRQAKDVWHVGSPGSTWHPMLYSCMQCRGITHDPCPLEGVSKPDQPNGSEVSCLTGQAQNFRVPCLQCHAPADGTAAYSWITSLASHVDHMNTVNPKSSSTCLERRPPRVLPGLQQSPLAPWAGLQCS